MRYRTFGVLALLATFWAVIPAASAGIDQEYRKPADKETWGQLLLDFVGHPGVGKSYALVVGISQYDNYPSLPTANDPLRMRDFLINEAGFDYVHVLTDDKATKARIEELMVDVLPNMIQKNDQFLFYWSGHGTQRPNALGGQVGYLPLASSPKGSYATMISMGDIQRWDDVLRAKQALFLLDACFSGLAGVVTQSDRRELQIDQLDKPAHDLVSAGTADEETIAGDRWGGSIFTDAVLRGVRGEADAETSYPRDGVVSLSELIGYIKIRVAMEAPAAGWTRPLTPQPYNLRPNTGEFFFLTDERKLAKLESGAQYQARFAYGVPVVVMGGIRSPAGALPSLTEPAPEQQPAPAEPDTIAPTKSDANVASSAEISPLGMTVATLSEELRTRYQLSPDVKGVVIVDVVKGGPAGAESLRPGDVIEEVSQEDVTATPEVQAKVSSKQQERQRSVLLLINRQGDLRFVALDFPNEEEPTSAALANSGADTSQFVKINSLGMTVATLSEELRTRYQLSPDVKGVVIVDVVKGGPAGAESLRPGDVIEEVSQEAVSSTLEVQAEVDRLKQENKNSVLLLIDRQRDLSFVAVALPHR